jgi:hypothetical protein
MTWRAPSIRPYPNAHTFTRRDHHCHANEFHARRRSESAAKLAHWWRAAEALTWNQRTAATWLRSSAASNRSVHVIHAGDTWCIRHCDTAAAAASDAARDATV